MLLTCDRFPLENGGILTETILDLQEQALATVASFEIHDTIQYIDEQPRYGGGYGDVYKGILKKEDTHSEVRTFFLRSRPITVDFRWQSRNYFPKPKSLSGECLLLVAIRNLSLISHSS